MPLPKTKAATLIADVGSDPEGLGELRCARLLEPAAGIVTKLLFSWNDVHTVPNLIRPGQAQ
jgi:hypothetical protein